MRLALKQVEEERRDAANPVLMTGLSRGRDFTDVPKGVRDEHWRTHVQNAPHLKPEEALTVPMADAARHMKRHGSLGIIGPDQYRAGVTTSYLTITGAGTMKGTGVIRSHRDNELDGA